MNKRQTKKQIKKRRLNWLNMFKLQAEGTWTAEGKGD